VDGPITLSSRWLSEQLRTVALPEEQRMLEAHGFGSGEGAVTFTDGGRRPRLCDQLVAMVVPARGGSLEADRSVQSWAPSTVVAKSIPRSGGPDGRAETP
jgi:hypothetical protein